MEPIDLSLNEFPIFIPDIENWSQPNCNYFGVDDLSCYSYMSFAVLMLNIRSCKRNFNQFLACFCNVISHFSCILLTETWLTADVDNVFNIPGFYCFDLYRNRYGGGLKLYVKNNIQARVLHEFTFINNLFEMISIELIFEKNKALFCGIYHPPTSSVQHNLDFIESLSNQLRPLVNMKIPLIMAGDLNINLLNPNNLVYVNTFISSMFEFGLIPAITVPTKVNVANLITRFSILDQIWMSYSLVNHQSFVLPLDITDHFPVGVFLKFPFNISTNNLKCQYRVLCQRGKNTFSLLLSNIGVQRIQGNFNLTYNNYWTRVFECYNIAFPTKKSSLKAKHPAPWMTPRLKQCIAKKSKMYKLFLKGRVTKEEYVAFRNRLTALVRRVKRLYYSRILYNSSNNPRKIWSCINDIMEKKACPTLKELKVGDLLLMGRDLANHINNHFVTAVSSLTAHLHSVSGYHFFTPPVEVSCFFYPTTPIEVSKIIRELKNNGNRLLDIHPSIIKENIDLFSIHISDLYNFSISESEFPDKSKIGRVNPVYKSGPSDCIDNYRPISVLPIFSKIFEKLTFLRMESFISRFNILTTCQYGFRRGRSTTQAIIKLMSCIMPAYHERVFSVCFFLDLKKAFDTIDHGILLQKLEHYGFRGRFCTYLRSYYYNRKQFVYINGQESDMKNVSTGVPQGSNLGPLCFSLFINDLPLAVEADTVLFADDAAFVLKSASLTDLYSKIEKLFSDLSIYLNNNRLIANSAKSKLMMFSSCPTQNLPDMVFAGRVIEWVDEFKYLGLTITNKLSFARHINNVSLNISRVTGIFNNLRSVVPLKVLFKIYYALAYPHLMNHIVIWGSAPMSHLRILTIRLNNLLRVILGIKWINGRPMVNTETMYKTNRLLKVGSIYRLCLFKLLRQLLDGVVPDMFSFLLEPHLALQNYPTRSGIFRIPAITSETERRFLPYQLITLYNELSAENLNLNINASVNRYKGYLIENQY